MGRPACGRKEWEHLRESLLSAEPTKEESMDDLLKLQREIETLRLLVSDLAKYLYLISDEDDTEVAELLKRCKEFM